MSLSGSVLIIDDEANIRNTLSRILQNAGCNVTTASVGSEALRMIMQHAFDLVFLDLRLPDMHGIAILREIRAFNKELPVIVLTGHGSINSAIEALHLEATDYLLKPVDPKLLIDRTTQILNRLRIERRKREIQSQISRLQAELAELESSSPTTSPKEASPHNHESRFIKIGALNLDLQTRRASIGESSLDIPPSSFEYLVVLARHAPKVVHYQDLVQEAQGYTVEYSEAQNLSRYHIHILRQFLEPDPKTPKFLLNVRGIGYQLVFD